MANSGQKSGNGARGSLNIELRNAVEQWLEWRLNEHTNRMTSLLQEFQKGMLDQMASLLRDQSKLELNELQAPQFQNIGSDLNSSSPRDTRFMTCNDNAQQMTNNNSSLHNVGDQKPSRSQRRCSRHDRHFDELYAPMSVILHDLMARGLLKPMEGYVPPNPLPKRWDDSVHYEFHQSRAHSTDNCFQLHHIIQNLIDEEIIEKPIPQINPPYDNRNTPRPVTPYCVNPYGTPKSYNPVPSGKAKKKSLVRKEDRQFDEFGAPISSVFYSLVSQGIMKPMEGYKLPNPLPKSWDPSKLCMYHQVWGHDTDSCWSLKHALQDLIDKEAIPKPPPKASSSKVSS